MINKVYVQLGSPIIAVDTVWDVYLELHGTLMVVMNDIPMDVHVGWRYSIDNQVFGTHKTLMPFNPKPTTCNLCSVVMKCKMRMVTFILEELTGAKVHRKVSAVTFSNVVQRLGLR